MTDTERPGAGADLEPHRQGNDLADSHQEPMSPEAARELMQDIRDYIESAYELLYRAYQQKAWIPLGYGSFKEYLATEFNMSRSRAYQLLHQARVVKELRVAVSTEVDLSEAQARDLDTAQLPFLIDRIKLAIATAPPDADVRRIVTSMVEQERERQRNQQECEEQERQFQRRQEQMRTGAIVESSHDTQIVISPAPNRH